MGGADAVMQRVACGAVPVPVGLLGWYSSEGRLTDGPQDQEMDWVTMGDRMHEHHHQDWGLVQEEKQMDGGQILSMKAWE